MVPSAGHRASTDDKTNRFKIPEIDQLLESLDREDVSFNNYEEINVVLIPQIDRLHHAFLKERFQELEASGYDTSRFVISEKVYQLHPKVKYLCCRYPRCIYKATVKWMPVSGSNESRLRFTVPYTKRPHSGPFH